MKKKTMLIPSMLDFHFPLLRQAFCSREYNAVVLENADGIAGTGLRYLHNDLCYPLILIAGQFISALSSGNYAPEDTVLMIPQAGDACRGSNYIHLIRKALDKAGFGEYRIISLNFMGLESESRLKVTPGMIRRGLAAVMYGDILMILRNQVAAYEKVRGESDSKAEKWTRYLSRGITEGRLLSGRAMTRTFAEIAGDFAQTEVLPGKKPLVGITGELYVKYCRLGNGGIRDFLKDEGFGVYINGFSWYLLYYLDSHLAKGASGRLFRWVINYLAGIQSAMTEAIRRYGFLCCEPFKRFKEDAKGYVSFGEVTADGWLIGAEVVGIYKSVTRRIACVQPFGCMPSHVFGRGIYSSLQRRLEGLLLSSIDFDSGSADVNLKNRLCMIIM